MVHTIRVLYQKPRMDRKYCLIVCIVYKSFSWVFFNRKMQNKMKMIYFLSVKKGDGQQNVSCPHVPVFCTWPTRLVGFYSASPLNQQSAGKHVVSLVHNPNSEPTSLCFCYLKLCPWWGSSKNYFSLASMLTMIPQKQSWK